MKTLAKYHAPLAVTQNPPGSGTWEFTPGFTGFNDGYSQPSGALAFFVSEVFFDLAGMAMDDKTLIFDGMATQTPGNNLFTAGAAGDSVVVYDIMTSIPVDFDLASVRSALLNHGLGFPAGTLNFEHVLYQRRRRYTLDLDTAAAFLLNAEDDQSGSMMPTASDRIYSYRVFQFYDVSGTVAAATCSGVRHLIQAQAKEEPTYEYLMRLKRSYDLQQEPDVD